jgi:hypothetical protein
MMTIKDVFSMSKGKKKEEICFQTIFFCVFLLNMTKSNEINIHLFNQSLCKKKSQKNPIKIDYFLIKNRLNW